MKKILIILFVFFTCSTCVYATTNANVSIRRMEIKDLNVPELNAKIDEDVTIAQTPGVYVRDIVWYKNGSRFYGDTFDEYAKYTCRVYLGTNEGFILTPSTEYICKNVDEKIYFAKMNDHYFLDLTFYLKEPSVVYPKRIVLNDIIRPRHDSAPDYSGTSKEPYFYEIERIEWYRDGALMNPTDVYVGGVYTCRVYISLNNGFSLKEGIIAYLAGVNGKITQNTKDTYIEFDYELQYKESKALVSLVHFGFKTTPSFGIKKDQIEVYCNHKPEYYDIDKVVWYKDSKLDYDEYFSSGTYTCRIYLKFINGGFPDTVVKCFTGENIVEKRMLKQADQWYAERTFTIKEPYIKTFQFEDLNVPEYGGIQDNKIISKEPGMYTPSMVYWYKNDKYMSNVDTYGEGTYKCKFTLNMNNECIIADDANAKIGNVYGTVNKDYNTVTVEAYYEVKKPTATWSNASDWAKPELEEASNNALIPLALKGKDYTQSITRAEFAAVAVKLYERLAYRLATPVSENPFEDTSDEEILKAYALGITNGTSATTFSPNALITRQEMATMMVRALKKVGVDTSVNLSAVSKFNDHAQIDSWALDGVYYMSNLGIIKGVGNNTFNVHGNATREEALAISIRSVKKLK